MATYTVALTHIPGYGCRDHLFNYFVCAVLNRLAPHGYTRKSSVKRAMRRIHPEARKVSQFDGDYRWTIVTA